VIVIKQFAAKFQIQFATELSQPFPNMGGLGLDIFLVIKAKAGQDDRLFSVKYNTFIILQDNRKNSKEFAKVFSCQIYSCYVTIRKLKYDNRRNRQ
jgi:hypothetical protein